MMTARALAMPWAPHLQLYCAPGRLVLKIVLGEAPEWIPTVRDVRTGFRDPASSIDGGPLDRVLGHFSDAVRVTRVHGAAASRHVFGRRNENYDAAEQAFGLARTFRIELGPAVRIDEAVDALRQLAIVEQATPHYLCLQPMQGTAVAEPAISLDEAWATRDVVRAAEALAYEPGDPALITAIVDTGVQSANRELAGRLRAGFDSVQIGAQDLSSGVRLLGDLTEEDMEPEDEVGHGTGCAAIIGAIGEEVPPGLGGDTALLPMRVLGSAAMPGRDAPVGIGALADIDDGLKRAIDLGARVLNLSFGTPVDSLDDNDGLPHADVVRYGLARGCVMIAASGNSGRTEAFSPACLDGVIAVGAVDGSGAPCTFSTRGDHVALSAPGERIVSAGLQGLVRLTGTSFAAPFVTAAAALVVSRANRRAVPVNAPVVRRVLSESARPFNGSVPKGMGTGILDAAAALRLLDQELDAGMHVTDEGDPLETIGRGGHNARR